MSAQAIAPAGGSDRRQQLTEQISSRPSPPANRYIRLASRTDKLARHMGIRPASLPV